MSKLLATGKTDLLDKFVSMRTRRAFKAFLAWDKEAGKVNFEFDAVEVPAQGRRRGKTFVRSGRGSAAAQGGAKRAAQDAPRRRRAAKKARQGAEGAAQDRRQA